MNARESKRDPSFAQLFRVESYKLEPGFISPGPRNAFHYIIQVCPIASASIAKNFYIYSFAVNKTLIKVFSLIKLFLKKSI